MNRILFIGDLNFIWDACNELLLDNYTIKTIQFTPTEISTVVSIEKMYDISDFHSITIDIMDMDPDIILYNSALNNNEIVRNHPEWTKLANIEFTQHLIDTISVLNVPLVYFSYQTNYSNSPLNESMSIAENFVMSYSKGIVIQTFQEKTNIQSDQISEVLQDVSSFLGKIVPLF